MNFKVSQHVISEFNLNFKNSKRKDKKEKHILNPFLLSGHSTMRKALPSNETFAFPASFSYSNDQHFLI